MHTYDVKIFVNGRSFHITLNGYTPNDARILAEAQYPSCDVLDIRQNS